MLSIDTPIDSSSFPPPPSSPSLSSPLTHWSLCVTSVGYRSVDSVTSQLASAVLDSRGPLQYDDRSIGGTSGVKGLPGGGGLEEDDANPWGDEDQVWALQEHVTKYKAQFDSVQKNGMFPSLQTPYTPHKLIMHLRYHPRTLFSHS